MNWVSSPLALISTAIIDMRYSIPLLIWSIYVCLKIIENLKSREYIRSKFYLKILSINLLLEEIMQAKNS